MSHTGVYLGDGTVVDARGTASGVVRADVNAYAWTHWASPWAQEEQVSQDGKAQDDNILISLPREMAQALTAILEAALAKEANG